MSERRYCECGEISVAADEDVITPLEDEYGVVHRFVPERCDRPT